VTDRRARRVGAAHALLNTGVAGSYLWSWSLAGEVDIDAGSQSPWSAPRPPGCRATWAATCPSANTSAPVTHPRTPRTPLHDITGPWEGRWFVPADRASSQGASRRPHRRVPPRVAGDDVAQASQQRQAAGTQDRVGPAQQCEIGGLPQLPERWRKKKAAQADLQPPPRTWIQVGKEVWRRGDMEMTGSTWSASRGQPPSYPMSPRARCDAQSDIRSSWDASAT
jgi:hypothetical protein